MPVPEPTKQLPDDSNELLGINEAGAISVMLTEDVEPGHQTLLQLHEFLPLHETVFGALVSRQGINAWLKQQFIYDVSCWRCIFIGEV